MHLSVERLAAGSAPPMRRSREHRDDHRHAPRGCHLHDVLLGDYLDRVSLGLSGRALRNGPVSRTNSCPATRILLVGGSARDRAGRELRSSGAWPLVCYAIGTDRYGWMSSCRRQAADRARPRGRGPRQPGLRRCGRRETGSWTDSLSKRCWVSAWRWCWPGTAAGC